jgi:hypothetical protein
MRVRSFLAVGSALLVSALLAAAANAGPYKVKNLQAISAGPSLFPAGCPGAFHDSEKPTGLELEPSITVNPANPRNIVATWKQDVSPAFMLATTSSPHRSTAARRGRGPRFLALRAARAGLRTPLATHGSRPAATARCTSADSQA